MYACTEPGDCGRSGGLLASCHEAGQCCRVRGVVPYCPPPPHWPLAPFHCARTDGPPPSSNRAVRNQAEKVRRDKISYYINELAMLVPLVSSSNKKLDKTSILRLTAIYLRWHQTPQLAQQSNQLTSCSSSSSSTSSSTSSACSPSGSSTSSSLVWSKCGLPPSFATCCQRVLEDMGLFVLVTSSGKILFISPSVESILGHPQIELLGQSLYNVTLVDDHEQLKANLCPDQSSASAAKKRKSFFLRLRQRSSSKGETPQFQLFHVVGHLRQPPSSHRTTRESQPTNDTILVAMMKPFKERWDTSLLEPTMDEWFSRHLIDGRIIYSDHRISYAMGYFSEELNGYTAFQYMHKDDVRWVLINLRRMYLKGEVGLSCYRLQMKTGEFIYVRTKGYLEEDSNKVQSLLCLNSVVSNEEGERLFEEMKRAFDPIAAKEPDRCITALAENHLDLDGNSSHGGTDTASTEDPEELKQAIDLLISDIPDQEIKIKPPPSPLDDSDVSKVEIVRKVLPPVSVQTRQVGVTPPSLKKCGESGAAAGCVSQCRPSVLRLKAGAGGSSPEKGKRVASPAAQLPPEQGAKRPRPAHHTSVIVSEGVPRSVIRCRTPLQSTIAHPPSPPPLTYTPVPSDEFKEVRTGESLFSAEMYSVNSMDSSSNLLPFQAIVQEPLDSHLDPSIVEVEDGLMGSLWSSELGKLEEGVVEGQLVLEDRMQLQRRQISAIEVDLAALQPTPNPHLDIYRSFTHLKEEHRLQQELLKSIQEDHQSIQRPGTSSHCKRELSLTHQDIGV